MERKGSSKSKAEDMQASEDETQRMRLEQERWVLARLKLKQLGPSWIKKKPTADQKISKLTN